jgi:hypothetical protein
MASTSEQAEIPVRGMGTEHSYGNRRAEQSKLGCDERWLRSTHETDSSLRDRRGGEVFR